MFGSELRLHRLDKLQQSQQDRRYAKNPKVGAAGGFITVETPMLGLAFAHSEGSKFQSHGVFFWHRKLWEQ